MLNLFMGDNFKRYLCHLQMCRYLTLGLFIQGCLPGAKVLHLVHFGHTLKRSLYSLITGPTGLECEINLRKSWP